MITATTYQQRRSQLASAVALPMVFTAHTALQAKSDMAYRFTQEPSFFYLTGINEADWQLYYDGAVWSLVKPAVSESKELFDGSMKSDAALEASGVNSVISPATLKKKLKELHEHSPVIATPGDDAMKRYYDFALNPAQASLNTMLKRMKFDVKSCRNELKKLRAIKGMDELLVQRQAIELTMDGFSTVKQSLATYSFEYEIEAFFNAAFRATGAGGHAYDPIVASGANACTLHYSSNQAALPKNGLILIDIGATVEGYAADITRTYAIGTPSERERAVHAAVEAAHYKIIDLIKPGVTFTSYQAAVDDIMKEAVVSLGLMKSLKDDEHYRRYFPHAIGHGLGIDVHESLGGFETFKEGMVLTVEPGIYIPEEGIGVRIEDNILVTKQGNENLSGRLSTSL